MALESRYLGIQDLVTERFPSPGGHDHQRVPAPEGATDRLPLTRSEFTVTEMALERRPRF